MCKTIVSIRHVSRRTFYTDNFTTRYAFNRFSIAFFYRFRTGSINKTVYIRIMKTKGVASRRHDDISCLRHCIVLISPCEKRITRCTSKERLTQLRQCITFKFIGFFFFSYLILFVFQTFAVVVCWNSAVLRRKKWTISMTNKNIFHSRYQYEL